MTLDSSWSVRVGEAETTVAWDPPAAPGGPVFVCAHGAGGSMSDSSVLGMSQALTARGIGVVRFNFLYRARGKGPPDPMPRLLDCFTMVVDSVVARLKPATLILGGRSMGGRAASMLVADGAPCAGLLLLAYPLHPPGKPDKMRTEHLPMITVPVLCLSGTRDPFCGPEELAPVLARLGSRWQMHWLEGADHSFHVPKRTGRSNTEILDEAGDTIRAWCNSLAAGRGGAVP